MNPPASHVPLVSVAMITYNHERFIAQAIESVLAQQTPFAIELVIGEDCSTDGTRTIVQRYARTNPAVVRPILHEKNVGMHQNHRAVLAACRGEFVAFLEGDDFWLSPQKLAIQVHLLTARPEAAGCFHRVSLVDAAGQDNGRVAPVGNPPPQSTDLLLRANDMPTPSVLVRRALLPSLSIRFHALRMGDWPSWLLTSLHGPFLFLGETMAAYREHGAGAWTGAAGETRRVGTIELFRVLSEELPAPHAAAARTQLALHLLSAGEAATFRRDRDASQRHLQDLLRLGATLRSVPARRLVSLYARVRFPRLYKSMGCGQVRGNDA